MIQQAAVVERCLICPRGSDGCEWPAVAVSDGAAAREALGGEPEAVAMLAKRTRTMAKLPGATKLPSGQAESLESAFLPLPKCLWLKDGPGEPPVCISSGILMMGLIS
jgi:hypothetical protein